MDHKNTHPQGWAFWIPLSGSNRYLVFRQPHRGCFVAARSTLFVLQHYSINRRSCKSSLAALCLLSVESSFGSFNCSRSGELFCRCDSMSRRAGGDNLRLCHRFESRLQRVSSCRWSLFCFSSEKRGSRCSSAPHRKRCGHKVSAVNYRNVR